jgi:hypothetical protein
MDVREFFRRLESSGFAGLAGAQVSAVIPLSEGLLNEILAEYKPPGPASGGVRIAALSGNRLRVSARMGAGSFLPPIGLTLLIAQQPEFPARPTLVLRLGSGGAILSRLGGLLGFLRSLPAGVRVQDDLVAIDLAELLARQGHAALTPLIERLQITTEEGRVIVSLAARVHPAPVAS